MKKVLFLITLTLVISFSALAGNKYQLKLKVGDSFVMTSNVEQKITQSMMGMEMAMDLSVHTEMDLVVTELSENEILFTQVYKSLMVTMKSPMQGMDISMDSGGESNSFNDAMRSLLGKEISVRVDMEGNLLSTDGMDQLLLDIEAIDVSGADLAQFFDEKGLKKNYKAIFPVAYGKDYEEGAKWELESITEGDMTVKLSTEYTASNVSKKKFKFTSESTSSMSGEQEQQGMGMSVNMEGSFSGEGEMNTKTGLLKMYSQTGAMTGSTVIEANAQMPTEMEIPMTIEMTTVTSLK
tara:strand:+ start:10368 stop:11252 length:885 start_codon:yes stop_codon:yes gene_type:complete